MKQDDKPGYVVDNHLSRTAVANSLKRPTWKLAGQAYHFLFGLASDGVYMCPCCYQQGGSLLHCPSTLTALASQNSGIFLLHWPWSHLHRTLSGILPCEARTFLISPSKLPEKAKLFRQQAKLAAAIIQPTYHSALYMTLYIEATSSAKFSYKGIIWNTVSRNT